VETSITLDLTMPRLAPETAPELSPLERLAILGTGPAGLTAAIYAARAALSPLVFAGPELGGQIALTTEVENFPGFPEGLTGPELSRRMQEQAQRFGARLELDTVTEADLHQRPFAIRTAAREYKARALIAATGASPRKLGVPGEREFIGRGVSYCATCDGFFFRGQEVLVVGGGDSALQEALFLTRFASRVTIVHRRGQLRANAVLVDRARANPRIEFTLNHMVTEIIGDNAVRAARLKDLATGQQRVVETSGVFIYVGQYPNTSLFKGQLAMDEDGFILVDDQMETSMPGVFAAGECHDRFFRQAVTSAGFGCMAAIAAERFLAN
jgi:thioredoxin reductase (NADPH)